MSNELTIADVNTVGIATNESAAPGATAWSDWLGMVASIGCAIHCAAMPFVIAYLPALGLSFLADEAFHKWMAGGCFIIALAAFVPGFRKHGRLLPVAVASIGLVMITVAAFGFAGECCPSCASEGAAVASASATGSASDATCTDASCQLCNKENLAASAVAADASHVGSLATAQVSSPWVGRIVPWLTPLGGLVLVSAHLLNRRFGCLCGCCPNETTAEAEA